MYWVVIGLFQICHSKARFLSNSRTLFLKGFTYYLSSLSWPKVHVSEALPLLVYTGVQICSTIFFVCPPGIILYCSESGAYPGYNP